MDRATITTTTMGREQPQLGAFLELLKPITWFPPMWAFGCGLVSSGKSLADTWTLAALGILLAGPLVCGTSQVVNDWFDRHVDKINEPHRPIPSGRVPGRWGLYFAIVWSCVSLLVSTLLGVWVVIATVFGLALAWMYSAPPFRLKQNGWWGNAAVGICYEGLPWFTAAAAVTATLPNTPIVLAALLYSVGAHGIMTLNDFKSIRGDTLMNIRTLPVQLGAQGAARFCCWVMIVPQIVVVALLAGWQQYIHGGAVAVLVIAQLVLMRTFLSDPIQKATWYSGLGVTLYVSGMLVTAFAIRGMPL